MTEPRRLGNKSLENIVRTDERYGRDPVWLGPRGRDYGAMLENPKPYQIANLYPDQNSSYWLASIKMPSGTTLFLRGRYPHARYCQFALYRPDPAMGAYTATGEFLLDNDIEPDQGSVNPFTPGNPRLGDNRDYTLRVVAEEPPQRTEDRKPNTLYAGTDGDFQMVYRVYLPDVGRDGSGDVGLPKYEAELPHTHALRDLLKKHELSAEEVREHLNNPLTEGIPPGMTTEDWLALVNAPDNDPELEPETAPARNPPVIERYFNNQFNLIGVFKPKDARMKMPHNVATGFGGDPVTLFMLGFVSRAFGPVLVIRGKMPKFPDTFMGNDGKGLETMTDWESRYWSVIMSEAPPSGMGTDALTDMQVPLDEDGNYTIVVSREEDRPANATEDNGVAWMDWGTRGEGLDDPANRQDFGLLVFRYMYNNPEWGHNPDTVIEPGTEAEVMGRYYPQGEYMDKETFEAKGLKP